MLIYLFKTIKEIFVWVFSHKLSQLEEAPAETFYKNPKIFFPTDLEKSSFINVEQF